MTKVKTTILFPDGYDLTGSAAKGEIIGNNIVLRFEIKPKKDD